MYTIKSVSDDGIYYLVNGWYKHNALWVSMEKLKKSMLFKTAGQAKASLTRLLKIMPEYTDDDFTVVEVVMEV